MSDSTSTAQSGKKKAGAFDIRNVIGLLLGIYGVILVIASAFGDQSLDKTGGIHANLWAGIALAVAGAGFLLWARVKPIVVPEDVEKPDEDETRPSPQRKKGQ